MDSNLFFPKDLRVLVVDDDKDESMKIERMLKKFNYKVTICNYAFNAIHMLGEKNERYKFEIVISDVAIGVVDGFEFIKYVTHTFEVPTIMMSGDGETSKVMKGFKYGACDHLLKPIEGEELRFIWQHAYHKRMQQPHRIANILTIEINDNDGLIAGKKRKKLVIDREYGGGSLSTIKKPRLVWNDEVEKKFKKAVDQIGIDKATPKKIHYLMKDPSATRENIASRLQKLKIKMGGRATSTLQVSQRFVGHSFSQPCYYQNSQLQQLEFNNGHSFNQSLDLQNHIVSSPVSMYSIEKEQNLESCGPSSTSFCPGDFPHHQKPSHLDTSSHIDPTFGGVVSPDTNDPMTFDCDISILMKEVGLGHLLNDVHYL